jgi:two-component system chemotaxis sensor kinase CheA
MSELDEVVQEFLVESREGLDRMDQDLLDLEKDQRAPETISSIFRTIHTIKGCSGSLGYQKLESLTHVGESLLSQMRDGERAVTPEIVNALLAMIDAVRAILGSIESSSKEGDGDYSALSTQFKQMLAAEKSEKSAAPAASASPAQALEAPAAPPAVEAAAANDNHLPADESAGGARGAAQTLRIDVKLLDKLMNLVGELVLTRNQMMQFSSKEGEAGFQASAQRLKLVTSELQEGMLKTRMQPISNIWSKFPRMVRDLSISCKKQVRVLMEGQDTDVDKTIIEALRDPMIHMVRNAVDHGIESPAARAAAGKPAEGTLHLKAFHAGGQVIIEIMDDGAGINVARVRSKVVEKGLRTAAAVERMNDQEILQLVFLPGFSTNAEVTNLSGRGVGMDVVKTNIERTGGTVDLSSQPGRGCTVRLKIPLTLAIIPALIVRSGGELFAIPQVNLLELVRRDGQNAAAGIEFVHNAPVYRLRGKLLPIVDLNRVLALDSGKERSTTNIVVLRAEDRDFGLIVDHILDTEEIVVKALDPQLKRLGNYAGATIMGDGRVALILDVLGLARQAHVVADVAEHHATSSAKAKDGDADAANMQTLLVFRLDERSRMALPLANVDRLEEFVREKVEQTSDGPVVQYRDKIMPLVDLGSYFDRKRGEPPEKIQVIVVSREGVSHGLIVEQILDIMEGAVPSGTGPHRRGTLGSTVIQKKVADLLDVNTVVADCDNRAATALVGGGSGSKS